MAIVKRVGRFAGLVLTAALLVLGAVTTQVFSVCSNPGTSSSHQDASSGGGRFTLSGVDTGIYRIEVYYFTGDGIDVDAADLAEATADPENMVSSAMVSAKDTKAEVTLKGGDTEFFAETGTFLVVVSEGINKDVTKYSIVDFANGSASIDWEEMEAPPESDDTGTE